MKNESGSRRRVARWPLALASVVALGALVPAPASAQVPARFYWKSLSGANAVPLIVNSISGNTNPFDPSHLVTPGGNVDATLLILSATAATLPTASLKVALTRYTPGFG